MTDREKIDMIRHEIVRLVEVRGYSREMANDLLAYINSLPSDNPEPSIDNVRMPVERWKEACKAACSDRNYRSHNGQTMLA